MRLFIFDFDMTLSKTQTDSKYSGFNPDTAEDREQCIRDNLQVGVAGLLSDILTNGDCIAIASFSRDKCLIKEHLLAALTPKQVSDVIIKTLSADEEKPENKNEMIKGIVSKVDPNHITGLIFVDDSSTNNKAVEENKDQFAYDFPIHTVQVHRKTGNMVTEDGSVIFTEPKDFVPRVEALLLNPQQEIESLLFKMNLIAMKLNSRWVWNGRRKAHMIIGAMSEIKSNMPNLEKNVTVGGIFNHRDANNKSLKDALSYHRHFTLFQKNRKQTHSISQMYNKYPALLPH